MEKHKEEINKPYNIKSNQKHFVNMYETSFQLPMYKYR